MKLKMPQEIEVWYIIPAIRRELAKVLIKNHNLNQKQVAELLGITEAAISQYVKSKRAKEVIFDRNVLKEVKNSANKIVKNNNLVMNEMYRLCKLFKVKKIVCGIHKKNNKKYDKCNVCLK
jgi:hypothetical protein